MADVSFPSSRPSLVALCLAFVVVTGLLVAPTVGTVVADDDDRDRHQHPDDYADDRGLSGTVSWLSDELSDRLGDSAVSISEGEYELGRSVLGDEYDERLEQYFDVTGETDGDDESSAGEAYENASTDQDRLATLIEEYRTTFDDYEDARDAGDDQRTRELARELEALTEEINEVADELDVSFETIENETDVDLSEPTETINETTNEVSEDQQTVRDEQFVATNLTVEDVEEPASIAEPVTVTGHLEATDGSTIEPEDGELVVHNESVAYELDDDGTITFEYRPSPRTELDTETVSVQYDPATQSAYLGSRATMNVSIEQTTPTLDLDEPEESVAYGDNLSVSGEIDAGGELTESVPIALSIDGEHLGELNATDGTFDGNVSVPANVSSGMHALTAEIALEDRALGPATGEADVTVTETETDLTLEATQDGDELNLTGSLETRDGESIANQSVALTVDDETVTVVTGGDGTFAETIAVPDGASGDQTVEAAFDGSGTNLGSATVETTVALPAEGGSLLGPLVIVGLVGLVLVAGAFVWYRRQPDDDAWEPVIDAPSSPVDPGTDAPTATDPAPSIETLLSLARTRYERGDATEAVRIGYTAVRRAYDETLEDVPALTHWEFYRRAREHGDDEHLRAVTEGYERARFAPGEIPDAEAESALTSVTALCDPGSTTGAVTPADD